MRQVTRILILSVFGLSACGPLDSGQQSSAISVNGNAPAYLALGDSMPFGKDPLTFDTAPNDNWFVGYPVYLAEQLDKPMLNSACSGETSGSFFSTTARDNGCRQWRAEDRLHIDYDTTQLEFAVSYLADHPKTSLVTLGIGAVDVQLMVQDCKGDKACILGSLPGVLKTMAKNLITIYSSIRAVYSGQIIFVPIAARNMKGTEAQLMYAAEPVYKQVEAAFNVQHADILGAFAAASAPWNGDGCTGGLFIPLPEGGCDTHYTQAGHELVAGVVAALVQ